jgi:hypothetical protein
MKNINSDTKAGKEYATAHDVHYKTKELPKAFQLYRDIIADHPETKEAGYSLSQVHNIVKDVVPKQELMDTLVAMTLDHFEKVSPSDAKPASKTPISS